MAVLGARQLAGQRGALGLLLVGVVLPGRLALFDVLRQRGQVGVDGLFEQALLLGVEALGLGRELQSLEHGHLVRELVDGGLLEGKLLTLGRDDNHQRAHGVAQLLRIQRVDGLCGDHGA